MFISIRFQPFNLSCTQGLCQANAAINSLYNVRSIHAAVDASHDSCLMTVSFDVDEFRTHRVLRG